MPQFVKFLALPLIVAVGVLAFTAGTASAHEVPSPRVLTVVPMNSDDGCGGMTTDQAEATIAADVNASVDASGYLNLSILDSLLNLDLGGNISASADANANADAGLHI